MIYNKFVSTFISYNGYFEIVVSTNLNVNKLLFVFNKDAKDIILPYIFKNFQVDSLMKEYFKNIRLPLRHIGIDLLDNRIKIYYSLYNFSFEKSKNFIVNLQNIIGLTGDIYLSNNFILFDSVGLDFYPNGKINLKYYEIVKEKMKSPLKEVGYLRDFTGRKKKFIRFSYPIYYKKFEKVNFISTYKYRGVKYFCKEENKKEYYLLFSS